MAEDRAAPAEPSTAESRTGAWSAPDELEIRQLPNGNWRVRNTETGQFWNWDPAIGMWRGADAGTLRLAAPGPDDHEYWGPDPGTTS
jgi:hypothetical protein